MQTSYRDITKEEYDRLKSMSYGEVNSEIEANLSDAIKWGYGYYGHTLREVDGKYQLGLKIGDSCD